MHFLINSNDKIWLPVKMTLDDFTPGTDTVIDVDDEVGFGGPPLKWYIAAGSSILCVFATFGKNIWVKTDPAAVVKEYSIDWVAAFKPQGELQKALYKP